MTFGMPEKEWHRSCLGIPTGDDERHYWLRKLVEEYHQRTEAFDQLHCKARNARGIAIPGNSEEWRLCNENARMVNKELEAAAARHMFAAHEWLTAKASYAKS